jgi:hypothetical protein
VERNKQRQDMPRSPGRPKGSVNKVTGDVKAMILAALDKAGGADYLLEQSKENPSAFLTLVGKVLPLTVSGDPNSPVVHRIERIIVRAQN